MTKSNKIISLIIVILGVILVVWGIVYATGVFRDDVHPLDEDFSNAIMTAPEPYEIDKNELLLLQSIEEENKKEVGLKGPGVYHNKEIGISFSYPANTILKNVFIGNISKGVVGALGRKFTGYIELRPGVGVSFGGVTEDYRYPQGGSITSTLGYEKRGDDYFLKFIWGTTEVTPSGQISINNNNDVAIIIEDTEIGQVLNSKQVAAFMNTNHNSFPGLVFVISSQNGVLTDQDIEVFNDMLSSIVFE